MGPNGIAIPEFVEAEVLFKKFLSENGYSKQLSWVFREDLNLGRNHEILLLQPDIVRNREIVEQAFDQARLISVGIMLDVLCPIESGGACAFFFVPDSREEAERRLLSGLKFGILGAGLPRIGRYSTRPRLLGSLFRIFGRERFDPWLRDVPSRSQWAHKK